MRTLSKRGERETFWAALLRGIGWGLLISVIFLAGFFARSFFPSSLIAQAQGKSDVGNYPVLTEVQRLLNDNYLRKQPEQKQLEFAAVRGMVGALNDRYTFVVDPPVARSESNVLAGKYGGIGVQLKRNEAGEVVLYPFRDSPASEAGVRDGDVLLKINGQAIPDKIQQDALDQMLRGEVKADNGVEILIRRLPVKEEKSFRIAFKEIEVPSVVWRVLAEESTIGYIQIMRFTNRTPEELRRAVAELRSQNVKAVVLDVRNNPGGLLQESITVAGEFLDGGVVVYERTRSNEKTYTGEKSGALTDLPMVVLINKDTASAAELVAGALKDRKRAMLIGQKTYGKGSVQLIFKLQDESALHVTTAEWFSPGKAPIDGKGIEPDISMIPDQNGRDVELGEAVRQLRDKLK